MTIREQLMELAEEKNAAFQAKLTPGIPKEAFLGIRVPLLRKLAGNLKDDPRVQDFLQDLPHKYYDENMLHSILISTCKDYDECMQLVIDFLPYIDNWAVCDTLSPKVFAKHKTELLVQIRKWIKSEHIYTCRFGIGMLMSHFLDQDFCPEYLKLPAEVISEEYYVNMMIAWYYATALAKQWKDTIPFLTEKRLSIWVHNKTIQKAVESYRISPQQKEYLRTLRRKKDILS